MTHVRTQIRNAVANVLTGLDTTGNRVFVSRVYPMERASLPGLIIMTESDEAQNGNGALNNGNLVIWSQLQLLVKAYAKGTASVDSTLDQIEVEVREALIEDRTLGGLAKDINWQSTTIQLDGGGEQPIGIIEMFFSINYRVNETLVEMSLI